MQRTLTLNEMESILQPFYFKRSSAESKCKLRWIAECALSWRMQNLKCESKGFWKCAHFIFSSVLPISIFWVFILKKFELQSCNIKTTCLILCRCLLCHQNLSGGPSSRGLASESYSSQGQWSLFLHIFFGCTTALESRGVWRHWGLCCVPRATVQQYVGVFSAYSNVLVGGSCQCNIHINAGTWGFPSRTLKL